MTLLKVLVVYDKKNIFNLLLLTKLVIIIMKPYKNAFL